MKTRALLTGIVALFLATGTAHLLVTGVATLSVLSASAAQGAPAAEEMPSFEAVKEFAHQLFEMSKKQGLSERETANHLASSMWWSEKMQVLCPSYFYVNRVGARYDYLLRLETWNMYYGVGKTATAILTEATTRRNENFNNVVGSQKGACCQSLKEFGIKHFGWAPLFEVIKDQ